MNTHITISVKAPATRALQCAYDTLLSFDTVDDDYIEENICTVYGNVHYTPEPYSIYKAKKLPIKGTMGVRIPCLITAKMISDALCEITIAANVTTTGTIHEGTAGRANEFAGEFLKRFSQVLKETSS